MGNGMMYLGVEDNLSQPDLFDAAWLARFGVFKGVHYKE
jgi:hypothetical protein